MNKFLFIKINLEKWIQLLLIYIKDLVILYKIRKINIIKNLYKRLDYLVKKAFI